MNWQYHFWMYIAIGYAVQSILEQHYFLAASQGCLGLWFMSRILGEKKAVARWKA